jgi:hypothetical protein
MHRQELGSNEEGLGEEHPSTLDSMNNLANMLRQQGQYDGIHTTKVNRTRLLPYSMMLPQRVSSFL